MHFSAHAATGLLGLAGISSGLPTGNTSASTLPAGGIINATAVTNTTETTNTTEISALAVTTGITNGAEDVNTGITILPQVINGTEDVNTSATDPFFSSKERRSPDDDDFSWLPLTPPKERRSPDDDDFSWLPLTPPKDRRLTPRERRSLSKRGDPPLPPRDRTLADHMENYGQDLPECYKKCMRSEDGKASIHMGQDTLGQICGSKWTPFAWWSEHHIYWCVNGKNGCQGKQPHRDAYKWLKWTCGDKPN